MKILVVDDDPQILDALTVGIQIQWQDSQVIAASRQPSIERLKLLIQLFDELESVLDYFGAVFAQFDLPDEEIIAGMHGMVAEGVLTTHAAVGLAKAHAVEMPIAAQMLAILHDGKSPRDAMHELMTRSAKSETAL